MKCSMESVLLFRAENDADPHRTYPAPRCLMAIHPDASFPISPKDQADVIRIFIELMRERHGDRREPEMLIEKPLAPRRSPGRAPLPGHLPDDE